MIKNYYIYILYIIMNLQNLVGDDVMNIIYVYKTDMENSLECKLENIGAKGKYIDIIKNTIQNYIEYGRLENITQIIKISITTKHDYHNKWKYGYNTWYDIFLDFKNINNHFDWIILQTDFLN